MQKQLRIFKLFLLPVLFFTVQPLYAAGYESLDTIKQTAKDFIVKNTALDNGETIDVQVTDLNSDLRLPACTKPLDVNFPDSTNSNKITAVQMTCNGTKAWQTYVPVNVQVFSKVLVAKNAIQQNETISADDVVFKTLDRNGLYNGYFKNPEDVIGRTANRLIISGAVLSPANLAQPLMVHREQAVDIIARANSIVVSMKGISKSDGALNQAIKVFNPSSKKTLDAIVVGPNQAQVVG